MYICFIGTFKRMYFWPIATFYRMFIGLYTHFMKYVFANKIILQNVCLCPRHILQNDYLSIDTFHKMLIYWPVSLFRRKYVCLQAFFISIFQIILVENRSRYFSRIIHFGTLSILAFRQSAQNTFQVLWLFFQRINLCYVCVIMPLGVPLIFAFKQLTQDTF